MTHKLFAFFRLTRPLFLGGGALLYALGVLIARYEGHVLDWGLYVGGQLFVTAVQLMTHYLNEYWDVEADRLNPHRTPFSGGSGVLARGELPPVVALRAAQVCLLLAIITAIGLIFTGAVPLGAWGLMLLGLLGAYFYSSPPLTLASSGYGELTTTLVVAGLVPALGHLLQARQFSGLVLLAILPLLVLHLAMLLAFEFPDAASDQAAGKRTRLVRLGWQRGAILLGQLICLAYASLAATVLLGLPLPAGLAALTAPLGLIQILLALRLCQGHKVSFTLLTSMGLLLFALTTLSMALGFWLLGN